MIKVSYYRGSVEKVDETIDEVVVDTNDLQDKKVTLAIVGLIEKYFGKETYYHRYACLTEDPSDGYAVDFGSWSEFVLVKPIKGEEDE